MAYYQQPNYYPVQQTQNNGFVSVRNEYEARNYPVAYGNSITFKDETAPYVYTKTMGFSQLDTPRFEKYRLVKEEAESPRAETGTNDTVNLSSAEIKSEFEAIWGEINALKSPKKKKEADDESK